MNWTEISISLAEDRSSDNVRGWAKKLADERPDMKGILPLLQAEHPVGMRTSWMLGALSETAPEMLFPLLPRLFELRHTCLYAGYDRSLAKWLSLAGVPESIEGEAADQMFNWLIDPQIKVAVKVYSMSALADLCKKYPELQSELRTILEEQFKDGSAAFKSRSRRVLKQLDKQGISPTP